MYPTEYLTYGLGSNAEVVTAPDAVKTFKITDHLGSTRAEIKERGRTQHWDYEPYGKAVAGAPPRKGFIDKEKDKESGLGDFGVRKYDDEIGRFLSPDPLWENYRAWSPYQYSANNPLVYKDPSGKTIDFSKFNSDPEKAEENFLAALTYLKEQEAEFAYILRTLYESDEYFLYLEVPEHGSNSEETHYSISERRLFWNFDLGTEYKDAEGNLQRLSPSIALLHEGAHAFLFQKWKKETGDARAYMSLRNTPDQDYGNWIERTIILDIEHPSSVQVGEVTGGPRQGHNPTLDSGGEEFEVWNSDPTSIRKRSEGPPAHPNEF